MEPAPTDLAAGAARTGLARVYLQILDFVVRRAATGDPTAIVMDHELTLPTLFFRQLELIGSSMANHAQFARATTWIGTEGARAPVSRVFDFDDLPKALEYLEGGEQVGKVVLRHPD